MASNGLLLIMFFSIHHNETLLFNYAIAYLFHKIMLDPSILDNKCFKICDLYLIKGYVLLVMK